MRIHHVFPYNPTQPGGVRTHTTALSDALSDLGNESHIFAPSKPLRLALGGTRADLTLHPRDILALRDFLRRPHDILHIQEPLLPLLGPLSLLHPDSAPKVVTLHSAEPTANRAYRWTRPLSRFLLNRADAVVCASAVSREIADPVIAGKAELIHPCLDLAAFRNVVRTPQADTILFVGRDEPRKGLPILLQALERLPEAQLVVAGPVRESTKRAADDRTRFLGSVPHEEIPALVAQATCAAFPATGGEALGLVLIEAMAAGLPIAASDIPGYRVATDDGAGALLSPPNDANALAGNLLRLLTDAQLREQLVQRGRQVAERFDARSIAERHLDLYRSLLRA